MQKTDTQQKRQLVSMHQTSVYKHGQGSQGSTPAITFSADKRTVQSEGYRAIPGWDVKNGPCRLIFLETVASEQEERDASPHYLSALINSNDNTIIQSVAIQDFWSLVSFAREVQPLMTLLAAEMEASHRK